MSKLDKTVQTPAPMPDPNQRIVEKKPDEQTHSRLVEEADKGRK